MRDVYVRVEGHSMPNEFEVIAKECPLEPSTSEDLIGGFFA
jgi:hypothetical protein